MDRCSLDDARVRDDVSARIPEAEATLDHSARFISGILTQV